MWPMPAGFRVLTARLDGWHRISLLPTLPAPALLETLPANSTIPRSLLQDHPLLQRAPHWGYLHYPALEKTLL